MKETDRACSDRPRTLVLGRRGCPVCRKGHLVLTITAVPTSLSDGQDVTLTINSNYTGAHIEVFSSSGPGQLTSFTTLVGYGGGVTTCTEFTNWYKLGLLSGYSLKWSGSPELRRSGLPDH